MISGRYIGKVNHGDRSTAFVPRGNGLLNQLPESAYDRLAPLLRPVKLLFEQVLYEFRAPIDYAYFATAGVTSALTVMNDGSAIEVATVGREVRVGHTAAFGSGKRSPNNVIVHIADRVCALTHTHCAERLFGTVPSKRCWIITKGFTTAIR
jgi:CRP-like cAMP-binding protein